MTFDDSFIFSSFYFTIIFQIYNGHQPSHSFSQSSEPIQNLYQKKVCLSQSNLIYIYFNMEIQLKQIQSFVTSPLCLFQLQPLDYPSLWQQQLITSYFSMQKILQKSHQGIIKDLHSPHGNMEQISQGFMYLFLLDQANIQRLQKYIIALRNQNWDFMTKNFIILLCQCGDIIKPKYQPNIVAVFNLLLQFNPGKPALIQIMMNFISYYDMSLESQSLIKAILQDLILKLEQDNNFFDGLIPVICQCIIIKATRISSYFLKDVCAKIISLIWSKFLLKCLPARNSLLYALESQGINLKTQPFNSIYNVLKQKKQNIKESSSLNLEIQYLLLPMRVRNVLEYLFKQENVSPLQIRYHLSWLQGSWQRNNLNHLQIMADMAKWISGMTDKSQIRVIILDDLCKRALKISQDALLKLIRSIFYNWFTQPVQEFNSAITSVLLLGHVCIAHVKIFVQMLTYIFKRINTNQARIRYILKEGVKLNFLNIARVINNRFVPQTLQQNLISLIEQPKNVQVQAHAPPQLQTQIRSQSYKFRSSESPIKSDEDGPNYDQQLASQSSIHHNHEAYEILIEQAYLTQFDNQLSNMLNQPNYENFIHFFKKISKTIAQARVENKEFVSTLLQQTAKIIYVAYNNQFEDFKNNSQPQKSIIYLMTSMLLKQWYQVTNRVEGIKSLVKKLCQLFPTAQIAFWYCFVMQADSGGASSKDYKNWIISKEKSDYVTKAVETLLGQPDQNFRKKAARFGIK